eukprot:gene22338-27157_t
MHKHVTAVTSERLSPVLSLACPASRSAEGARLRMVKSFARGISALVGWAPQGRITARTLMAALIGVSAPILLGLAIGRLQLGLTIGLGALFLSGGAATGATHRWRAAGSALIVTLVSVA